MIAEPYICIKGQDAGAIEWFNTNPDQAYWEGKLGPCWQRYADFEREKLKELGNNQIHKHGGIDSSEAFTLFSRNTLYYSSGLISYSAADYDQDSESGRLLMRAEFLKAVCEREGVEWLPLEIRKVEEKVTKHCRAAHETVNEQLIKCGKPCGHCKGYGLYGGELCDVCLGDTKPPREYYTKEEIDERLSKLRIC